MTSTAVVPGMTLSPREREVLSLMASGYSYAQTAERLHLAESTIKTYAYQAVTKLGARNRVNAMAIALVRGDIKLVHVPGGAR